MKKVCPRFKQFEEKLKDLDAQKAVPAVEKKACTLIDYLSGREIQDIGPEANRQAVLKFLVEEKGYAKDEIETDVPIRFEVRGEQCRSRADVVVSVGGRRLMVVKCAPGSLGSREREAVSAARLLEAHRIPVAVVSDGKDAVVLDSLTGRKIGTGLEEVFSRAALADLFQKVAPEPFPEEKLERERLVFRTYDSMNVNIRED